MNYTDESAIQIGRTSTAEIDALADLWVALAADQRSYQSHLRSDENRGRIREAMARHVVTDGIRVARVSDDIVGFVMYSLERGDFEQDETRGVIRNLYVKPAHRSRGIGSRLLKSAETELAGAGATHICLEAMAQNERARKFYERHGYTVHRVELEKAIENDTHSKEDR
ncbi:GNAT family N-acetyltransferase [Halogeometricum borinquense]|uniref:GNAT family N-acetyltransferase n=1 Tax=Halogeometricum borinquense TaxID=60847 RepID=A0A6C0UHB5_9EURY|nr:GNAT family N-acetyltransferase [Halogeometricum borinquense]QIB74825.1 GNAT family N-acetyltransferase [Halogeometricum borinquense]QIQ76177.1 GNAT family N-acetyltransferase [Halogeometricum borinquense]